MPLAVTPGAFIFIAIVVLLIVALVLTAYTRRGSGIGSHPIDGRDGSPGASGPGDAGATDHVPDTPGDFGTR